MINFRILLIFLFSMIQIGCVSEGTSLDNPIIELEGATTEEIENGSFVTLESLSNPRFGNHYMALEPDQPDYFGYTYTIIIDPKGRTIYNPKLVLPLNFQFQGNGNNFDSLLGTCRNIIDTPCTVELLYVPRNNFQYISEILFHYSHGGRGYRSRLSVEMKASNPVDNNLAGGAISDGHGSNSCAIGKGGEIKCWGNLSLGNLGVSNRDSSFGDTVDELNNRLDKIELENEVLDFKLGPNHGCVLLKDNKLKCWGHNNDGELGTDNSRYLSLDGVINTPPLKFKNNDRPLKFTLGEGFTCALLERKNLSRYVQCWGRNDDGQAGTGDVFPLGYGLGNSRFDRDALDVDFGVQTNILDLVSGRRSSCALFEDGKVSCWGYNQFGNLGKGDKNSRGDDPVETQNNFIDFGAGVLAESLFGGYGDHFCAIMQSGENFCWGQNLFGQLGTGNRNNVGDDPAEMGANLTDINFGANMEVLEIHPGLLSTCFTIKDTSVLDEDSRHGICLGYGNLLGQGDDENLGDDAGEVLAAEAIDFGADFKFHRFIGNTNHTCAISTDDKIKCFGLNAFGVLGQGHTETVGDGPFEMGDHLVETKFPSHTELNQVFVAPYNTCAITDKKYVSCYGSNASALIYGSRGANIGIIPGNSGASMNAVKIDSLERAIDVTVGLNHACALFENKKVKCWGHNEYGQLAQGNVIDIIDLQTRFNEVPYIDLGTNVEVKSIHAGEYHTCAKIYSYLDGIHRVKCWGRNNEGQIGVGSTSNIGDQSSELGDNLAFIDFGTDDNGDQFEVIHLAAGSVHNCAVLEGERILEVDADPETARLIKCWGANDYGQLGQESSLNSGDSPGEMGNNLNEVRIKSFTNFNEVKLGKFHSCVRVDDQIYCWGRNNRGQLGINDTRNIGDNGSEMGAFITNVSLIGPNVQERSDNPVLDIRGTLQWDVSPNGACLIDTSNDIACWGDGGLVPNQLNQDYGEGTNFITSQFDPFIPGKFVTSIHARLGAMCITYSDGSAACWGKANRLGNGRSHEFSTYYPEYSAFPFPYLWF